MILKVIETFTNGDFEGCPITKYFSGNRIVINKTTINNGKNKKPAIAVTIDDEIEFFENESGIDECGEPYTVQVQDMYLMNNEGKTIEKIDIQAILAVAEWEIASK